MSSATSPVRQALEGYVAGRLKAERVVEVVTEAYYGDEGPKGHGTRSGAHLRPILAVIERAHPGVIELASAADTPGFAVRLAERPFPRELEPVLRAAVEAALVGPHPGLVTRLVGAIRRLFTASA